MKLFVIILHYGNIAVTKNCVKSLIKNDKFPKKIILVNNTKDSLEKEFAKEIIILNNKKNLGFAKGVNKGIFYALKHDATHALLLNNDTTISRPFIKKLADEMQGNVGIVGPAITFKKNGQTLFDIGGKVNRFYWKTFHENVLKISDKNLRTVDYISGCCMLIKKEVFKKIGLFDENFFLYYEDADFCLRAKKAEFTTALIPSVIINHALSGSRGKTSGFTIYHLLKSNIYFGKKYARNTLQKIVNRFFILFQSILFLKANPKAGLAIAKALISA